MKKDYSKISTYFIEFISTIIPLVITALLYNGLMCILPILEGKAIDSLNDNSSVLVLKYALGLFGLVLFVQINRFFKRFLVRVFSNKMSLKMREVSLNNLFNNDLSYFETNNPGEILTRNLSDIYDTVEGVRKMTTEAFDTFVLLIGYFITMCIMDYRLTLYVLPFFVASVLASQLMKKLVYKNKKEYKKYLSINKNLTLTLINNELNYRGYGVNKEYSQKYKDSVHILRKKSTKSLIMESSLEPIYLCIAMAGLMVIAYVGGMNVIKNNYLIGSLTAFITTYSLVARKAGKLGKLFNAYQSFKVSWERAKPSLVDNSIKYKECIFQNNSLILRNFTYQYKSGFTLPVINLEAKIGDVIGICGKVHTGKSTILKALSGLYTFNGDAYFLGLDLKNIKEYKENIVNYSSNTVSLFSDTLKNNITLAKDGNLELALKTSALDIDLGLIGGLEKEVSHTNQNISGGQAKRIQMARALYQDSKLVLLDDPFQSVDKKLLNIMIKNIREYKDRLIFLVSNNKDVLKETDKVIFLDNNEAFINDYDTLLNNTNFKNMMEVQK